MVSRVHEENGESKLRHGIFTYSRVFSRASSLSRERFWGGGEGGCLGGRKSFPRVGSGEEGD